MAKKILAATGQGVLTLDKQQDNWVELASSMESVNFTAIAISGDGSILAGSKKGLYLSQDGGKSWQEANQGLSQPHLRSLAFHPEQPELAYAGTEPAAIFFSKDGGNSWQECKEVAALRDRHQWFLPYSPEAGCIRGFAFLNERAFAAVEVGGMLESKDFGESWQLTQDDNNTNPKSGNIHADVHRVFIHPTATNIVAAPTGGGFFISKNQGKEWDRVHHAYCRSVWLDPADPDHLILGPADGPDRNGRIEQTSDGGKTWNNLAKGLDVPWPRTMVEHFTQVEDQLFAVLSNGRLISSPLEEAHWITVLPEIKKVREIAVFPSENASG